MHVYTPCWFTLVVRCKVSEIESRLKEVEQELQQANDNALELQQAR